MGASVAQRLRGSEVWGHCTPNCSQWGRQRLPWQQPPSSARTRVNDACRGTVVVLGKPNLLTFRCDQLLELPNVSRNQIQSKERSSEVLILKLNWAPVDMAEYVLLTFVKASTY